MVDQKQKNVISHEPSPLNPRRRARSSQRDKRRPSPRRRLLDRNFVAAYHQSLVGGSSFAGQSSNASAEPVTVADDESDDDSDNETEPESPEPVTNQVAGHGGLSVSHVHHQVPVAHAPMVLAEPNGAAQGVLRPIAVPMRVVLAQPPAPHPNVGGLFAYGGGLGHIVRIPLLTIRVRSMNPADLGVMYNIRPHETFQQVYSDYASRVDRRTYEIILIRQAGFVTPFHTPSELGVQNGEVLFVRALNPAHNVDTNVKVFYVRDLRTNPIVMKMFGHYATPLSQVKEEWARRLGYDPETVVIIRENSVCAQFQSIRQADIKNDDHIFLLPNM